MDDSLTICNETIDAEEAKTISKNITCKTQNFYILLAFLLIVFALIAVSIYYYLIKYSAKKEHCHFTLQIISYTGYVTIKDLKYLKIISVNPLYLIFNKVNGYSEEIHKHKYLTLVPTNERKDKIKKYVELWSRFN